MLLLTLLNIILNPVQSLILSILKFSLGILLVCSTNAFSQNHAAYFASDFSYYECGMIDITGSNLTIEALVKMNGNGPYAPGFSATDDTYNDIVSKHREPVDCQYLLRPDHCELTTTHGYFRTPAISTKFSKDSFYHVAMTYDGKSLNFYVNGCLYSKVNATGEFIKTNYITTIGQLAFNPALLHYEQMLGYVDEVRIWNITRTEDEIRNNMHNLPNPTTTPGLLAYYNFENNSTVNLQGNTLFDAIPKGNSTIREISGFSSVKPFNASFIMENEPCTSEGKITIHAIGGKAPYQYSFDGINFQTANEFSFTSLPSSKITAYVKDDGISCLLTKEFEIVPKLRLNISPDNSICNGDSIRLEVDAPGLQSVNWSPANNITSLTQTNTIVFPTTTTTYYVTAAGINGCTGKDSVKITVYNKPIIDAGADRYVCSGDTILITPLSNGNYIYTWEPGINISNTNSLSVYVSPATSTQYILSAINSLCISRDTVSIAVIPKPLVNIGADTLLCSGSTILLNAQNPGATYLWNNGISTQTIVVSEEGVYTVIVDDGNCQAIDSITIKVKKNNFTLTPLQYSICENATFQLTAAGGDVYKWLTGAGALNHSSATLIRTADSSEVFYVVISEAFCGYTDTLAANVTVIKSPDIQITQSNAINCVNPTAILNATGAVKYNWLPSNDIKKVSYNQATVAPKGAGWFYVTGENASGCNSKDSIYVEPSYNDGAPVFIPNAFTPNNDGVNDCFGVINIGNYDLFELRIFNRWGELVFMSKNASDCWNGIYKGIKQPAGVFVYEAKIKGVCGEYYKKGTVTLIR